MKHTRALIASAVVMAAGLAAFFVLRASREAAASRPYSLLAPGSGTPLVSTGTISDGESISSVFRHGTDYGDIIKVETALEKAGSGVLRQGDIYAVGLSTSGEVEGFTLARGEDLYRVFRSSSGFAAERSSVPVTVVRLDSSGAIGSSLWDAMTAQNVPPAVIMEFADIFAWKVDFLTEPREGDKFALVWEERNTALGTRSGYRILAASYNGSETGPQQAFYYGGSYYDAAGSSLSRAFLRAPLSYRRISSYFSEHRYHPILRFFRPHHGIDYAAPMGTPVSAVADGQVIFAGRKDGFGNFIEIRHGGGYVTGYGHLRNFVKGMRAGMRVSQGQLIAYVGMTGLATGPHLHFQITLNGKYRDFLTLKLPPSSALADGRLKAFLAGAKPLEEELDKAAPLPAAPRKG